MLAATGLYKGITAARQDAHEHLHVLYLAGRFVNHMELFACIIDQQFIACLVRKFSACFGLAQPIIIMLVKLGIAIAFRMLVKVLLP